MEFLLLYNPMVVLDVIAFGDQNVLVRKRELKAAVVSTWADVQRKLQEKEKRRVE